MGKKIIFTKEQEKEIIRLYKREFKNPTEIGKVFNCSIQPIHRILREKNIDKSTSSRRKELYCIGKMSSWNKGLTKETDERIRKASKKQSEDKKRLFKEGKLNIWNKGLTKEDPRVAKYCNSEGFKKNQFKKGMKSFLKGLNKENSEIIRKASLKQSETKKRLYAEGKLVPHNKGKPSLVGEKNPMYGRENKWGEHTEETKQILREKNLGKKIPIEQSKKHSKYMKKIIEEGKFKCFGHGYNPSFPLEKNGCWLGGKSFEPYTLDFNKKFKEFIRQRDNLSCLKCNMFQEDHIKLYKRKLICHHIDYLKENTFPENCCALCVRCNAEVNFNRPHWTKFFQSLLSERYGYKYSNGEIILNLENVLK